MKQVSNYQLLPLHLCPNARDTLYTILCNRIANITDLNFLGFTLLGDGKAVFEAEYLVRGEKKRLAGNLKVFVELDKYGTVRPMMDVEYEEFRSVQGMVW
jgi:hypothetical protein